VEIAVVTPEDTPLALFGSAASETVSGLLEAREVALVTGRYPVALDHGTLRLAPRGGLLADCVVALPRLRGEPIAGVPHDGHGFVPTDRHGRVKGADGLLAAGDITTFPIKQGGLAAQQATAAAESIAAQAAADVRPEPFRPILRGLLLTGDAPAYLRAELSGGRGNTAVADFQPLWWPPAKIVGRRLAPFLAERARLVLSPPAEIAAKAIAADLSGFAA
jgi:sulfide:quinone oxidoreductase